MVHEGDEVGDRGVRLLRPRRAAEPAVVVPHDAEVVRENVPLRVPHAPVAEPAVDEDDGRAAALHLVVETAALDVEHFRVRAGSRHQETGAGEGRAGESTGAGGSIRARSAWLS